MQFLRDDAVMSDWNLLPPIVENTVSSFSLPQDIRESYFKLLGFNMLQRRWMKEFITELERVEVPALIMKGHGLWGSVYHQDYPRVSADIDFLVEPENIGKVKKILGNWAPLHGKTLLHYRYDLEYPYNFRIELHWDLAAYRSFSLDFCNIWSDSFPHPMFESDCVRTMCLEDIFIHTLIHSFNHRNLQTYMKVDLLRLLNHPRINIELILEKARLTGCMRLMELTVASLRKTLGSEMVLPDLKVKSPGYLSQKVYDFVFKPRKRGSVFDLQRLFQFSLLDNRVNKLRNMRGAYQSYLVRLGKKITNPLGWSSDHH